VISQNFSQNPGVPRPVRIIPPTRDLTRKINGVNSRIQCMQTGSILLSIKKKIRAGSGKLIDLDTLPGVDLFEPGGRERYLIGGPFGLPDIEDGGIILLHQ
jgi:hypothetical protein